jgi:hypothetical protein
MNRKLLPYERGLCEQLGLSEEEYLLFLAAQKDYSISEAKRREELRGDPVSIVLTVVGILFQVASALLAPKPEQPKFRAQRRDRTYAPRYGFNSTQELAQYGDPLNLVYCNQSINPQGAVRVNSALLWSSVESTGSGQYMQLLLLVGAAGVKKLDFGKTAFGQLPAKQFAAASTWMYYAQQNGPVLAQDKVWGNASDPALEDIGGGDIIHRLRHGNSLTEGYSMAFTPTTAKDLGVYAPIPINVDVFERDQDGDLTSHPIGIESRTPWTNGQWYDAGDQFQLFFKKVDRDQEEVADEAAKDLRLQLLNNLDRGAIYELGSAHFRLLRWEEGDNIHAENISARFECTEAGFAPSTPYDRTQPRKLEDYDRELFEHYRKVLEAPSPSSVEDLATNNVIAGTISAIGGSLTAMSEHKIWLGLSQKQQASRTYKNSLITDDIYIKGFGKEYDFNGTVTLTWINDLDKTSTATYPEGGSIAYTELILEQFLADKPKLPTKALRKEYSDDLKRLRKYRDDLRAGRYKRQLRNDIKNNDPTVRAIWDKVRNLNNLIAAANGEEMDDTWRAEARQQQTAVDLRNQIAAKREEIESYADNESGGRAVKKVKRLENQIENLRDTRRDFINDYIAQKRRQAKKPASQIRAWRDEKDDLLEAMNAEIAVRLDDWRTEKVREAREATYAFTGYDGNRYACGVNCLIDKLDDLKGEFTTDQVGTDLIRKALRDLIAKKREALQWLRWLAKNWDTLARDVDDDFFSKCLVKRARVDYQTITKCDRVMFNFRARLFRRISGRQLEYGTNEAPDGYKLSDNGIKRRVMFFRMMYRDLGADLWQEVPKIFAIERASDTDHYVFLQFISPRKAKREFRFVPLVDARRTVREKSIDGYIYIKNGGSIKSYSHDGNTISFRGRYVGLAENKLPDLRETGPMYTNEWDMFSVHSDTQIQFSFDNGPEASLVNVTEQVTCPLDEQKYKGMSLLAFHTYASNGVDDLRTISTYALEGKASWKVNDTTGQPYQSGEGACFAPDIFADTVLDSTNGIKNFANANAIDWEQLAKAKRFCKNNGLGCRLFMDGVIADRRSWREFWAEVAPFSLLEFARLNGRETLLPALPITPDGQATTSLTISALFNESNILEESYKEEYLDYGDNTKDLVATVIYREVAEDDEVFPRNTSVTLCRADTNDAEAVWQTFDLSDWVSQKRQAELYGRYLCQQRRYVGRTIEFQTVPTDSPVQPGAYIVVDIGLKRWDSVRTGVVQAGGTLDLPLDVGIQDGVYTVMTYDSTHEPQVHQGVAIENGVALGLNVPEGSLFVLGNSSDARRVFRVTEVSLDEDAVLTVRGAEHPCQVNGAVYTSLVADLSDGLFREVGVDCT